MKLLALKIVPVLHSSGITLQTMAEIKKIGILSVLAGFPNIGLFGVGYDKCSLLLTFTLKEDTG